MALLQVDYKSKALSRKVHFNVILPSDMEETDRSPYPTLYLLHGIFGDSTSWLTGSCVQRYAEEKGVCVIMPDGENGFYIDHPDYMNCFSTWIGDELVRATRAMFPLSKEREQTWLGGFSMGGYGALRNGLKYADTFGRIIAFSSALILDVARGVEEAKGPSANTPYLRAMFGAPEKIPESDLDPAFTIRQLKAAGKPIPEFYLSCGEQDSLLEANLRFVHLLEELGVPFTWRTTPGGHDWDFWEQEIRNVLLHWNP